MKKNEERLNLTGIAPEKVQFWCLAVLGIMELALVAFGPALNYLPYFLVEHFSAIPGLVFLGTALMCRQSSLAKRHMLAGTGAAAWILTAQLLQYLGGEEPRYIGMAWSAYLLAFPFAAMEKERGKGLKWMAAGAVALCLLLSAYVALLVMDVVPGWMQSSVRWDRQVRLQVFAGPNIDAECLLIGIAFTLLFFFKTEKRWGKGLLLIAAAVQFIAVMLTNCRTVLYATCAMIAGIVFFGVFKGGWKRFLVGGLLAVAVFGSLLVLSDGVYGIHIKHTGNPNSVMGKESVQAAAEEDDTAEEKMAEASDTMVRKRSVFNRFGNFGGRAPVWKSALQAARWNPKIMLRGTPYVSNAISQPEWPHPMEHTHNSWLEMLVAFGLPGLLVGLYFAFLALRGAAFLLLRKDTQMPHRIVALLVLCLLLTGLTEPSLFAGYVFFHFVHVVFFLTTGYVDLWREEILHPERV